MLPNQPRKPGKGSRIRQRLQFPIEIQLHRRIPERENHQKHAHQLGRQQGEIHHAVHTERGGKGKEHDAHHPGIPGPVKHIHPAAKQLPAHCQQNAEGDHAALRQQL